jgi:hypothetical protein
MRVLIDDSEGIESTPIMHGYQLLPKLFYLLNGLQLLHYDLEDGIFNIVLSDFLACLFAIGSVLGTRCIA